MTVREMQMAFDTRIQLISKTEEIKDKPDSYTILQFINRAQERYLTDNFLSEGSLEKNIEHLQKRSDVLRSLIARSNGTESATPISSTEADGGIELELPSDYLHYIKSFSYAINALAGNTTKTWTPNRVVNHSEIETVTDGIFNSPILRKPCILFEEGDKAILYTDRDTDVYNYSYTYLRKPLEMSLDATGVNIPSGYTNECEIDSYNHVDIVELAVALYIKEYKYLLAKQAKQ